MAQTPNINIALFMLFGGLTCTFGLLAAGINHPRANKVCTPVAVVGRGQGICSASHGLHAAWLCCLSSVCALVQLLLVCCAPSRHCMGRNIFKPRLCSSAQSRPSTLSTLTCYHDAAACASYSLYMQAALTGNDALWILCRLEATLVSSPQAAPSTQPPLS